MKDRNQRSMNEKKEKHQHRKIAILKDNPKKLIVEKPSKVDKSAVRALKKHMQRNKKSNKCLTMRDMMGKQNKDSSTQNQLIIFQNLELQSKCKEVVLQPNTQGPQYEEDNKIATEKMNKLLIKADQIFESLGKHKKKFRMKKISKEV